MRPLDGTEEQADWERVIRILVREEWPKARGKSAIDPPMPEAMADTALASDACNVPSKRETHGGI